MPGFLFWCLAHQAHRGAPLAGVLLCTLVRQALKGAPWVGPYSVVQCIRCLMGQPLCCSAFQEREAMVMAPPATRDSAGSPCFHGCLAFLHTHFPPQRPPSHPLDPTLRSQQQPSHWDSTIPKLQLPATPPFWGSSSLFGVSMTMARTV